MFRLFRLFRFPEEHMEQHTEDKLARATEQNAGCLIRTGQELPDDGTEHASAVRLPQVHRKEL